MNLFFQITVGLIEDFILKIYRLFFLAIIILIAILIYNNKNNEMIATYVNVKTKKEVYVQNFTATLMDEDRKPSKQKIVIYKEVDDISTFVVLKKHFDKEYKKK
jgi:hypothetical protein